jgi:arylsulfatase A-like enzyme
MKFRICLTFAIGLLALFAIPAHAVVRQGKPNIILVLADDLGWRDVGYQSGGKFLTPNINRLASEGMAFSSAYAGGANCEPSRACLMSGAYPPRHGVYAVNSTDRGPKALQRLVPIPNTDGLRGEFVTMAEALKAAGYATGHFGKWHLAGRDGALPSQQGFDVTFDSFGEGELKEGSEGNQKGPPEDPKGVYTLTHKAIEFITAHQREPFFCYLAHHAIHGPQQSRPGTLHQIAAHARAAGVPPIYMGCTVDLDDSLGTLLAKLKELGLEQNTLLVFMSDNGATPQSSQEPLRGAKGALYEGGIRVPLIVRWPGEVKAGSKCDVPVINEDLYPTFLAAAGAPAPAGAQLDGESLLPLLRSQGALHRTAIYWHFPGYLDQPVPRGRDPVFRTRPVTAMRAGDWKLLMYHEEWQLDGGRAALANNHAVELYNLKDDIGERRDLAQSQPQIRDQLVDQMLAWMKATNAQMTSKPNPQYDPANVNVGKKGRRAAELGPASDEDH